MPLIRVPQAGAIGVNRDLSALPMRWLKLVMIGLCSAVRYIGRFRSIEHAKVNMFPVERDMRSPFPPELVPANADKSRRIVGLALHVLMVFRMGAWTQIRNSVVRFVAIHMVNLLFRKLAMNVKPRKAMGEIFAAQNSNLNVSGIQAIRHNSANKASLSVFLPREISSGRIVMQRLQETRSVNRLAHVQPL